MQRFHEIRRRGGFTLIELLVVIGIITLLVGLLLPAVHKIRAAAIRARTKAEIAQISEAIESFKTTYDVKYIPSGFYLTSDYSQVMVPGSYPDSPPPANPVYAAAIFESRQFYSKVWPKGFLPPLGNGATGLTPMFPNQANMAQQPNNPTVVPMDGNQCLVFFLGGIPPTDQRYPANFQGTRNGFLNSPTNPLNYNLTTGVNGPVTDGAQAKGPFFDFKLDRLDAQGHYLDPYGSPYHYYSSKNGNDYSYWGTRYALAFNPQQVPGGYMPTGGYGSMSPLIGIDGKYINPTSYQIISRGRDQQPGPGNVWDAGIGDYAPGGPGGDDISNFAAGPLGGSN